MPQPDDLPVLFLPRHLSAAAAADFIDALHQLIAAMERHYPGPPRPALRPAGHRTARSRCRASADRATVLIRPTA
jgi:hypothetical protein